jgi:polysaccharide export outer membrane protein
MVLAQRLTQFIVAALIGILVTGCAGTNALPGTAAYQPTVYRLAAGDRISITVFGEESLSREYAITPQGDLAFPLLGDIPVVDMTVGELQAALRARLGEGYVNDPRVTVEVLNYRPFYILGEVSKSGEFPFSDGLTVTQAVALAGGFTYRAERQRVFILRYGQTTEEVYDIKDGRPVYVAPGDTIRVGERYF